MQHREDRGRGERGAQAPDCRSWSPMQPQWAVNDLFTLARAGLRSLAGKMWEVAAGLGTSGGQHPSQEGKPASLGPEGTRRSPGEGLGLTAASRTLRETHASCLLLEGGSGVRAENIARECSVFSTLEVGLVSAVAVGDIKGRIRLPSNSRLSWFFLKGVCLRRT